MSKKTGWIAIDKMMAQEFKQIKRPYSKIEAMFSFSLDENCGRKNSIKGYSELWSWSRNKVRKFLSESRTPEGHSMDTGGTRKGHPIHFIDKGLWTKKDTQGTPKGHPKDTLPTPTINPNPNPIEKTSAPEDAEPEVYRTKKGRKLTGKRLDTFMMFWGSFGYKKGKAEAADAWLKISSLTDLIVNQICEAAKIENSGREEAKANGKTPKMAEGWLSGRRWEDETYQKQNGSGTPEDILKKYGMEA